MKANGTELRSAGKSTPSRPNPLLEVGAAFDLIGGIFKSPLLALQPRGNGEPVLVLPGFGTSDRATVLLRRYLRRLGYRVRGWGLGRNHGDVPTLVPLVIEQVARFRESSSQPVRLVGWSLGGNLAREVARERPELVERVVTLGTPVVGGPRYTSVAGVYERQGYDLSDIEAYVDERNSTPIRVPITAIYSRRDGIVDWRAAIDHWNPEVDHVEVRSSHIGMTFNASVLRQLARSLKQAEARPAPSSERVLNVEHHGSSPEWAS